MSSNVFAISRPGTPYQGGQFEHFLGGLNNSVSDTLIDVDELSAGENYCPDPENAGILTKRDGISKVSSQITNGITSLFEGAHDVWATHGQKVVNDAGTDQGLTLTAANDPDWASFNGLDIVVNGTEEYKYNGSAWAVLGGTPPNFKYIESYNNFLFGSGHDKAKVRWSDIGDPETWDATHEWNLNTDSNDDVTGMKAHNEILFVFTERSFYHLKGYGEYEIQILYKGNIGCASHRSIVSTPHGLFWWSAEGIIWSPDGFNIVNISELKIPKTFDNLNAGKFSLVHGVWNSRRQRVEFYVFDTSSTTQDLAIYYYPRIGVRSKAGVNVGSFWVHSGAGVQMGASAEVTLSGVRTVYLGSAASSGYIYRQTGDDDDGTAISGYLETKRDGTESGHTTTKRSKAFIPQFLLAGQGQVTLGVYFDNATSLSKTWPIQLSGGGLFVLDTSQLDQGTLGATDELKAAEIPWKQRFRLFKFRLSDQADVRTKIIGIRTEGYMVKM